MNEEERATAKQVGLGLRKVADVLKTHIDKVGDEDVNMNELYINHCGSPLCFAGWFAYLSRSKEELKGKDWKYGARLIACECGLEDRYHLTRWANNNPKLWGNEYGDSMFGYKQAFGVEPNEELTLSDITAHLREVSERCAQYALA